MQHTSFRFLALLGLGISLLAAAQSQPAQKSGGDFSTNLHPTEAQKVRPSGSVGVRAEPAKASPAKTLWISIAVLTGIVAIAVLAACQIRRGRVSRSTEGGRKQPLVEILKEELFQLEIQRAQGSISYEDYATTKQALGHCLQRAMTKSRRR